MNLDEMKQTWTEHTVKLDRLLKLNLQALQTAQMDKSQSALNRYKMHRVVELIPGVVFAGFLGAYVVHRWAVPTLAIPALILDAFIIAAIAGCVRHLILLRQINFAEPVTVIQAKLEAVKLHMLDTSRLMILSLPFYFAYIVLGFDLLFGVNILAQGDRAFIYANAALSVALFLPAIWVFRNLNFRNASHPVIRIFINGAGGKPLLAAADFLNRIDQFKAEEQN
ncbi:MAG: hypothetical protein WBW41_15405 [Verrucomicrobiia bacterium]